MPHAHLDWVGLEPAREARLAAKALQNEGLSVRDIGTVLGVSHQRAQQLTSAVV